MQCKTENPDILCILRSLPLTLLCDAGDSTNQATHRVKYINGEGAMVCGMEGAMEGLRERATRRSRMVWVSSHVIICC